MAIEAERVIPHSVENIVEAYATEAFHSHLAAKVGSELKSFEVNRAADGSVVITSVQAMGAEKLPDLARKVVKGTVTVNITDTWGAPDAGGSRRSDTVVNVNNVPVKAVASQNLHARSSSETLATVRGDVDIKIPLLGKKLKAQAEPHMAKFIQLQATEVSKFIDAQR
ncbi:DUF2505 domain-containing protein [Nesterenkonia sphaerica]|uniref:DUF2505 domain-containing protein n=1 Tax=Nesterenkonia sphaerica TaxID=1804988 RepID=A0A5R9ADF7_9MICC|nr:DUF2505 domain-containing protein [Nesterenkonia sphaerica]TLP76819.1 DUF2505 domain-containing protein [Nesterenkonia sphaerica]